MSLPDFKNFTLKDWMYFIGVLVTLVMSWAILNQKVEQLNIDANAAWSRQYLIDQRQDLEVKERTLELKSAMKEETQEIKQEIRELRRDIGVARTKQ